MKRLLFPALGLAFAFATLGCGLGGGRNAGDPPSGATVSGTVTYNRTPLGGGTVKFTSEADRSKSAIGSIDTSGNYTVKNPPLGKVIISVETDTARQFDANYNKGAAPSGPGVPNMKYVPIPPAYKNPDTSKLSYTVTAGEQTHNITLR